MRATVCTVRDPFAPHRHRTVSQIVQRRRIRALAPKTKQPHICLLNGRAILRAEWRRRLRDGDVVTFIVLPQGGGGSNPLRMILMIVVAVFAPYAAAWLTGQSALFAGFVGAVGFNAAAATLALVGNALINALVPAPKPPSAQTASQLAAPSPTYSLQGQGNAARLDQPIPVIYGRHIIYPDFAAAPYVEFGGNEQYLYQLMVIGQGQYDIEAIRIEDTPIDSFDEIEYQVVPPGGELTLFPANVVTSVEVSGQELLESEYLGPYVANAAGTQANIIGVDVVTPRGLYFANDEGGLNQRTASFKVEARLINDDGDPVGDWVEIGAESITAATTTPQRRSYRYPVPLGRYEVRATRTNTKESSTRASNELSWGSLRAYLPGTPDYGDVTLIAFRMRASNNLSQQASRRINLIVHRLLPTFVAGEFPNQGMVFDERHADGHEMWVNYEPGAELAIVAEPTAENGSALRVGNNSGNDQALLVHAENIRFDPRAIYEFTFRVRVPSGAGVVYLGVAGVLADGTTFVTWDGTTGSVYGQHYIAAAGAASADWTTYTARMQGHAAFGSASPVALAKLHESAVYFRPMMIVNYAGEAGVTEVDFVRVEKLPVATRNPAFAFADIARAQYGAHLPDSRIDLNGLNELADVWDSRNDYCDIVFDSPGTIWEGLTTIARTGRAHPYLQGGVLHCYRDGPATLPVGMFTPRNMLKGSFKVTYKMPSEEQADAVDVEYFDSTVWRWKTVRCALPDSAQLQPVKVKLIGVNERAQAWREGMYMAASNRYRRRFVSFDTEMEGFIPSPGDLLTVTHDMPKWGQFAEVVAFNPTTRLLRLTEQPEFDGFSTHYLAWRRRDGRPLGPWEAQATADPYVVELLDWDELTDPLPDTGGNRERSHVAFGPAEAHAIRCRALAIRPRGMTQAELSVVVESDAVHTADTGAAPGASGWQLPAVETAPRVLGLTARSMPDDVDLIVLSWAPTPGAQLYLIEQSADQQNWTRVGDTTANAYSGLALYGPATWLRVAAVGIARGPWVEVAYGQSAGYMWSAFPTDLMWNAEDTELMWRS